MTERTRPAPDPVRATARQASNIVERLDIMWEQARNDAPHPYVSVSQLRVMYIGDRENGIRMRALTRLLAHRRPRSAVWSTASRSWLRRTPALLRQPPRSQALRDPRRT
ncbi:hypothetical protein ACFV8Z_31780 [Streptomyces sp. NPDC059837]|uniref:hypothetical protein n=1 Tax=Streptomyces TaxID=1883 RepID=UPI00332A77C1